MTFVNAEARKISADLNHATRQMNRDLAKPVRGGCIDHWQNIIYFGRCWKHNADGALKSQFTC